MSRKIGNFCSACGPAAQQAMNENDQTLFVIFRQGEEELCIASWARWDAQLKGLMEPERRCRDTRKEIQVLSE